MTGLCLPPKISSDLAHALMGKLVHASPGGTKLAVRKRVFVAKVFVSLHIFSSSLAQTKQKQRRSLKILKTARHVALKVVRQQRFLARTARSLLPGAVCTRGCPRSWARRGGHTCRRIDRGCRARETAPRITLGAHLINGQVGKRARP